MSHSREDNFDSITTTKVAEELATALGRGLVDVTSVHGGISPIDISLGVSLFLREVCALTSTELSKQLVMLEIIVEITKTVIKNEADPDDRS